MMHESTIPCTLESGIAHSVFAVFQCDSVPSIEVWINGKSVLVISTIDDDVMPQETV